MVNRKATTGKGNGQKNECLRVARAGLVRTELLLLFLFQPLEWRINKRVTTEQRVNVRGTAY